MHIKINNEMIEFKLEQEKNIGEVIQGLEDWIISNGNIIQSISIDHKQVDFDYGSQEFKRGLDGVSEISIITQSHTEFAIATLVILSEYVQQMYLGELFGEITRYHDNLIEGLNLIHEGMTASLRVLKVRPFSVTGETGKSMENILGEIDRLISIYRKRYIDREGKEKIEKNLTNLLAMMPLVFKWAVIKNKEYFVDVDEKTFKSYIKILLKNLLSICIDSLDKFEIISSSLQVGEDTRALSELYFLSELLEEIIELLRVIEENQLINIKEISEKITRIFSQVGEKLEYVEMALKDGDMITIGDTMEYELKQLFIQLIEELKKIDDII